MNINTRDYWNSRFSTGDWEKKGGRSQTRQFALSYVRRLRLPHLFSGTIVDFGCGLADSMPVYRKHFPRARLIGVDISEAGIEMCREKYGDIATFIAGDTGAVPHADVIVCSNVFEHLSQDEQRAAQLKAKCDVLYIIVPFEESLHPGGEHVNVYNRGSFNSIRPKVTEVFVCRGWGSVGWQLWYNVYFKNIFRLLLNKRLRSRDRQIMFRFGELRQES